jgi:4-amino-4-deoxy-L-arabinose transferase-like glycosyltransferase
MTITATRPASSRETSPGNELPASSGPRPDPRRHPARRVADRLFADRSRAETILLGLLLLLTAAAYLWDLSASGYANTFYAAAVQAGTHSWKALLFGSLDSSNFITVDKPPASLWVMALSGRLFGFSSWSMLAPQALLGVGTVALVYGAVRRWRGAAAGLISGAVVAITPVAALMFRFNNPDALLVMLLAAGAYCVTRAIEKASAKWLIAAGAIVGFAFLAKMGEALLVVPAFGLAYLVAAPTGLRRRVVHVLGAGAAVVASAGWWVVTVSVWPVSDRPMIDGSPTNNIWNLIVGYNGLSRLEGGGAGGGGGANFSGAAGLLRLFNSLMGGQAAWLLPAALVALVGGLALTARARRTDRTRAALIIWGGWLLAAGAVFSLSQGTIHTYYTVALVPPMAGLIGIGSDLLWRRRHVVWARAVAGVVTLGTAAWAVALLDRTPTWYPWLRPLIAVAAVVAVAALAISTPGRLGAGSRWRSPVGVLGMGAMTLAFIAGPLAYSVQTITTAHTGSVPSAGPASATFGAGGPGTGTSGTGPPPQGTPGGTTGSRPSGPGAETAGQNGKGRTGSGFGGRGTFGAGGGPGTTRVSSALVKALESDAVRYRWVAATDGSQSAASLELATGGDPVMAIGGFNDNGGNISLITFEHYVKQGLVHYYIAGQGSGGGPGTSQSSSSSITAWVESHFHSRTIGGETVYNLTSPLTG